MHDFLTIVFNHDLELKFRIEKTPLAELWLEKMHQRTEWPLDDPRRFYGFNDLQTEKSIAEKELRACIDTINSYQPIIEKDIVNVDDQDLLNYLHNIFEKYHGLLDKQNTQWWIQAPDHVKQALADLNIAVHRAESVGKGNRPRFVCTWFGMPKNTKFDQHIVAQYGRPYYEFGGVYINYVEIGKTLEDLSIDDDRWIGDDAFKPFLHYSADFSVRFYDAHADLVKLNNYFQQHRDFFAKQGIDSVNDYRVLPYRYKVAQLQTDKPRDLVVAELSKNQFITDIYLQ